MADDDKKNPAPAAAQTPAQASQNQMAQATKEANESVERQRQEAAKRAQVASKAAREQSKEVLEEQENMRPVPSQDDADRMKAGAYDPNKPAEGEETDGPAQRAFQRNAEANNDALGYQTRETKRGK